MRSSLLLVLLSGCLTTSMPGESYRGVLPEMTTEQRELSAALRAHVAKLATEIGERHPRRPAKLEEAALYIEDQFSGQGFEVARHQFRRSERNIEVEIRGQRFPAEIIVIGAHYDTATGTPGADDNATGVAALIEVGRRLRGRELDRTVRLVAFANEEPPYFGSAEMGSAYYAKRSRERDENIVAMYSLEMLGFYSTEPGSQSYPPLFSKFYPSVGNFIAFVGDVPSRDLVAYSVQLFRRFAKFPSEGASVYAWIPGVGYSDQLWFWKMGYRAVMVTDTSFERNPHYHETTDTPDRLDFDRMARVTLGLVEVFTVVANPEK